MKILTIFFSMLLFAGATGFSQCSVNSFIEDNYTLYAKFLVLRDIQSNPADPDYDNPIIQSARLTPYLEKLSAIYENPNNEPIIDLLFGDYSMNVNPEYMFRTPYKLMVLGVDNSAPWLDDFINTGISGNTQLDDLVATYNFFIGDTLPLSNITIIYLDTTIEALNIPALQDEFIAVDFVDNAEPDVSLMDRFNYDGVPYFINNEPVEASDISVENDRYTFCLYAGDCPAGCLYSECWTVVVAPDCSTVILSASELNTEKFSIYPNPSEDTIHLHGVTSEIYSTLIYSVTGKIVYSAQFNSETIDISNLNSGLYFLEVTTSEGNKQTQKFIKK